MREIAIGDIHGCHRAWKLLLDHLQPAADDTLILLGDYIDRGPASCEVVESVLELRDRCKVIPLTGNHEVMLLNSLEDGSVFTGWLKHGGRETLDSYARCGYPKGIEGIPDRHWEFFRQTLDYWETGDTIFVHATVDPTLEMNQQPPFMLFWERFVNPTVHKSGKRIVCGHTSQPSGRPALFKRGLCLDTWAYGNGWLTAYDLGAQKFVQTNQRGGLREFDLPALLK